MSSPGDLGLKQSSQLEDEGATVTPAGKAGTSPGYAELPSSTASAAAPNNFQISFVEMRLKQEQQEALRQQQRRDPGSTPGPGVLQSDPNASAAMGAVGLSHATTPLARALTGATEAETSIIFARELRQTAFVLSSPAGAEGSLLRADLADLVVDASDDAQDAMTATLQSLAGSAVNHPMRVPTPIGVRLPMPPDVGSPAPSPKSTVAATATHLVRYDLASADPLGSSDVYPRVPSPSVSVAAGSGGSTQSSPSTALKPRPELPPSAPVALGLPPVGPAQVLPAHATAAGPPSYCDSQQPRFDSQRPRAGSTSASEGGRTPHVVVLDDHHKRMQFGVSTAASTAASTSRPESPGCNTKGAGGRQHEFATTPFRSPSSAFDSTSAATPAPPTAVATSICSTTAPAAVTASPDPMTRAAASALSHSQGTAKAATSDEGGAQVQPKICGGQTALADDATMTSPIPGATAVFVALPSTMDAQNATTHSDGSLGGGGAGAGGASMSQTMSGPTFGTKPKKQQKEKALVIPEDAILTPTEGHLNISLGIACRRKKLIRPTMQRFMRRFIDYGFSVVPFDEDMILNAPHTEWPRVDCAIMFTSSGFPLHKACDYATLHPDTFYLTEPESQKVLEDRRDFYTALKRNNIPVSHHVFCNRDGWNDRPTSTVVEFVDEEYIVVDGVKMYKPFVEKPVDSDDHDVYLYYPKSMGGGCRQLFRKVADSSSRFDPNTVTVRKEGSYVYEKYVRCELNRDVKCYTVGPNFVYAEARKAPTLDGVVVRDSQGKEVREKVDLRPREVTIARKITKVFRQLVCGFDLLRINRKESYVCDVNGWSFVKGNPDYVDRASEIVRDILIEEVAKRGLHRLFRTTAAPRELLGVVGVFRHADRTPKQKVKLVLDDRELLDVAFAGETDEELVFKTGHPKLAALRVVIDRLIHEATVACVEQLPRPRPVPIASDDDGVPMRHSGKNDTFVIHDPTPREKLMLMRDVLTRDHEGLKIQVKPQKRDAGAACTSAQFICKWGGWLTDPGHTQAAMMGRNFVTRVFGAEANDKFFRDVQVMSNNERRVMATASDFVGGNVPVSVDEKLLGDNSHAKAFLAAAEEKISQILHVSTDAELEKVIHLPGLREVINCVVLNERDHTPLGAMRRLHHIMRKFVAHIQTLPVTPLYRDEPFELFKQRWETITTGFLSTKTSKYDVGKIANIFDYVSHDVCYNQAAVAPFDLYPLFTLAQTLSFFVSELENGITRQEQLVGGSLVCAPLLQKIFEDLQSISQDTVPHTRLYFTSKSHISALRHVLYAQPFTCFHPVGAPLEMNFLAHFVFKVYRYPQPDPADTSASSATAATLTAAAPGTSLSAAATPSADHTGPTPARAPNATTTPLAQPPNSGYAAAAAATTTATTTPTPAPSTSPGQQPQPQQLPTLPDALQIEVHFSTGMDKNMFGIVQDHHVAYNAVTPMIRIHNNMDFKRLRRITDIATEAQLTHSKAPTVRADFESELVNLQQVQQAVAVTNAGHSPGAVSVDPAQAVDAASAVASVPRQHATDSSNPMTPTTSLPNNATAQFPAALASGAAAAASTSAVKATPPAAAPAPRLTPGGLLDRFFSYLSRQPSHNHHPTQTTTLAAMAAAGAAAPRRAGTTKVVAGPASGSSWQQSTRVNTAPLPPPPARRLTPKDDDQSVGPSALGSRSNRAADTPQNLSMGSAPLIMRSPALVSIASAAGGGPNSSDLPPPIQIGAGEPGSGSGGGGGGLVRMVPLPTAVARLHSQGGDGSAVDSLLPSHPTTPLHVPTRLTGVPVDDDKTAF